MTIRIYAIILVRIRQFQLIISVEIIISHEFNAPDCGRLTLLKLLINIPVGLIVIKLLFYQVSKNEVKIEGKKITNNLLAAQRTRVSASQQKLILFTFQKHSYIIVDLSQFSESMDSNKLVNKPLGSSAFRPICPQAVYYGERKPSGEQTTFQTSAQGESYDVGGFISTLEDVKNFLQGRLSQEIRKYEELTRQNHNSGLEEKQSGSGSQDQNQGSEKKQKNKAQLDHDSQSKTVKKIKKNSTVNETKNIPKNFGKAIISFIQRNQTVAAKCLSRYGLDLDKFIEELKIKKKFLHSIRQLRSLWIEQDFKYAKVFRELSYYFLRKGTHEYIFGSRVADFGSHLKYRYKIMKVLRTPHTFNSIKI